MVIAPPVPRVWQVPAPPSLKVWATAAGDPWDLLAAHVAARHGCAPASVSLTRRPCPHCGGPHGRPAVAHPPGAAEVSVARADGIALVALGATAIGVDVEAVPDADTVRDVLALLHPEERQRISAASAGDQPALFAAAWTRNEAYLKATGEGLAALGEMSLIDGAPAGWLLSELDVGAGRAAAVVWRDS